MKTILPFQHQTPLSNFVLKNPEVSPEAVPMDVLVVGGGPSGLATAIRLAQLVKADNEKGGGLGDVQIGVLEKASQMGGHVLSGAVMNPRALRELFPAMTDKDFPLRTPVEKDEVYFMTESSHFRIPTPPTMNNHGNFVVSACELVRWLGTQAEGLGVNLFTSFPAASLLVKDNAVIGVRTVPAGQLRNKEAGPQYMPATDLTAKVTVLSEGTRGPLAQSYCKEFNITAKQDQIFALGVKEIWKTKKVPKGVVHTLGWPLPSDAFGGSFIYPMAADMVAFGLVVGLDYKNANLDTHQLLQRVKKHPLFMQYLEGGELVEWGAKTIPEGGAHAVPEQLCGDGLLMTGDTVGLVNVPALKGIHYAIQSGIYAADSIFEALKKNDFSKNTLSSYSAKVHQSYIMEDLKKVRNMRQAFSSGFFVGGMKAGLMTLTGGAFPGSDIIVEEDAKHTKEFVENNLTNPGTTNSTTKNLTLSKVDGVYLSGNKTRDDIPQHLTVGKDISPEVASMYQALCPAGVYERKNDQLVVNAPNCIDCKATDVIGPRWEPREGGAGPNYNLM
jgi:electron-transferring-flavoprotein dehydrogenase